MDHFHEPRQPVEFWPSAAIQLALKDGDIETWRRIAAELKHDPYGRIAGQFEEILEAARPDGVANALWGVLCHARVHLETKERNQVSRHVRLLVERSGLTQQEFATRIGMAREILASYLDGSASPSASLMIRMRRLSDRFAKANSAHSAESADPSAGIDQRDASSPLTGVSEPSPRCGRPRRTLDNQALGPHRAERLEVIVEGTLDVGDRVLGPEMS